MYFYEAPMGKHFSPAAWHGGEEWKLCSQTPTSCGTLGRSVSLSVSQYQPHHGVSALDDFVMKIS